MVQNIKRANDLLNQKLAGLVNQLVEFPDGLLTVVYADLSGDGQAVRVGVSVLPVSLYGTALRQLKKMSASIAKLAAKQCRLSRVPKIIWLIDDTAEQADRLDRLMHNLL